jgi:phosphate transport system substrate-binding protein
MVSRTLKSTERGLTSFTIAMDGIAIVVHGRNPVPTLTRHQIIDIYTGKILNWREVGGPDMSITVVNKAKGRSALELFLKQFSLKKLSDKSAGYHR